MEWNVLARNGVLQLQDPGPATVFLRSMPPGAYTTTRSTNNASNLLLWERHLQRLAQSVQLLAKEMPHLFLVGPAKIPSFDDHVKLMVQPSLRVGLQKALEVRNANQELTVMAYITGTADNDEENTCSHELKGFDVYVHISRCIPVYSSSETKSAARLAIMGFGRFLPNAKHTDWVRTRQALEKARPDNITEVILSNDGDLLLEGLVTNFFVVMSCMSRVGIDANDERKKWDNIVLQTAPLKGVLPGVIRKLILEICQEHGISCEEAHPSWSNRRVWVEAFTTNSVRLIQPVGSIQRPLQWDGESDLHGWQENSWEYLSLQAPGELTQFIQSRVANKCAMQSVSIDSLLRDLC